MARPKKKGLDSTEKQLPELTEKILKYWYVDKKTRTVKHINEYVGKLIGYDLNKSVVLTDTNKPIRFYTCHHDAAIALLRHELQAKKEEWEEHVNASLDLNAQISKIKDDLDLLEDVDL
jgi:hypothetical protein